MCSRCIASSCGDESANEYKHTFDMDGQNHRRFAKILASDYFQVLSEAWLSYFKQDFFARGPVDPSALKEFASYDTHPRVVPLMRTCCGLAKEIEDALTYQSVVD